MHLLWSKIVFKLKVGFKQDIKKWYTKLSAAETLLRDNRTEAIKAAFKERGFPICEPRDGGKGSSNDGMIDCIFSNFIHFFI